MNDIQQLDRDALVLAYAAGELPEAQKVSFEAQLAGDPALAAELVRVREGLELASVSIGQLDATQRAPVQDGVAVRRASRAIGQWTIDRLRPKEAPVKQPFTVPWWVYPSAAAAMIIVSFLIWSSRQQVPTNVAATDNIPAINTDTALDAAEKENLLADSLEKQFDPPTEVAIDDSSRASASTDTEDMGPLFLSPQEETFR